MVCAWDEEDDNPPKARTEKGKFEPWYDCEERRAEETNGTYMVQEAEDRAEPKNDTAHRGGQYGDAPRGGKREGVQKGGAAAQQSLKYEETFEEAQIRKAQD
jgi:hypothetical protein